MMESNLERLTQNLGSVRERLEAAARRSGRGPGCVTLVAVTKKVSSALVRSLVGLGCLDLGENYPQELWRKGEELADLGESIRWHLIGHLQTNKARKTAALVDMIHSVDSLKLLRRLDSLAGDDVTFPPVCLQVNTSEEASKHGWSADGILEDAEAVAGCRKVRIAGLMTIAGWGTSAEEARPAFIQLRQTRDELCRRTGLPLPELSMGMSNDFESAIEEGATLVRVGSALFEGVSS
jgi:pyridoxal phosphate enzyme (YggS family)